MPPGSGTPLPDGCCTRSNTARSFGLYLKRLTFSPDGRRVVLPGPGAIAQVWNAENGELVFALDAKEGGVATAVYSPDGSRIVTSGEIAQVWDAATGTLLGKLEGHTEQVVDAEFAAKDGLIVTASWDGTAKVWGPDFAARRTLGGHRPNLQSAQFSPDGTLVITRDATGVKVWDATTGRLRAEYDTRAGMSRAGSFAQDACRCVADAEQSGDHYARAQ